MKKLICLALSLLMMLSVVGCSNSDTDPASELNEGTSSNTVEEYDVDLTKLSSTIVYSEVCNMMTAPDDYIGKKIKMSGNFSVYHDESTNKYYYACLIADATACCSQGIEFVLDGDYSYPDDYPEINSIITVTGIFDTYEENGYTYCQLINAQLE